MRKPRKHKHLQGFPSTSGGNRMPTLRSASRLTAMRPERQDQHRYCKKRAPKKRALDCTSGGNRTHTILLSLDFESSASTNSATEAIKNGSVYPPITIGAATEAKTDCKAKKYFIATSKIPLNYRIQAK